MRLFLFGLAALALGAQVSPPKASDKDLEMIRGYRSWAKANPEPHPISANAAGLCRYVSPAEVGHSGLKTSSLGRFVTVYVNPIAAKALAGDKPYPVGSILVKAKLLSKDATEHELLTVMVKRGRGFSSRDGDWEYYGADGHLQTASHENSRTCASCHFTTKATDYVFGFSGAASLSKRRR